MADSKVSELTSATSVGGSDFFYVVQSNASKKVTAATLFANAANPTLSGNILIGGSPQILAAPGLVSILTPITQLSADASGGTIILPQGANGQVKIITLISTSGGSYTLDTSNIAGGATISFDRTGQAASMLYTNNKWVFIGGSANVVY